RVALHLQQWHHGMLGYAVPAAHLKPLPPCTCPSEEAAHAPAVPVLCHRSCRGLKYELV
uniref:Uncharacterized protein n=1 Tax=Periophthalmus magnuspinnatus TaxID=409849 RepID=A0A3B4B7H3_9GOBI